MLAFFMSNCRGGPMCPPFPVLHLEKKGRHVGLPLQVDVLFFNQTKQLIPLFFHQFLITPAFHIHA